jgi:ADP-ribosylation factor family
MYGIWVNFAVFISFETRAYWHKRNYLIVFQGGNAKIRPYWKNYFENTDVLIFVVRFLFLMITLGSVLMLSIAWFRDVKKMQKMNIFTSILG